MPPVASKTLRQSPEGLGMVVMDDMSHFMPKGIQRLLPAVLEIGRPGNDDSALRFHIVAAVLFPGGDDDLAERERSVEVLLVETAKLFPELRQKVGAPGICIDAVDGSTPL